MSQTGEGVRLAKRVAAEQSCSRSQAEALIVAGRVQVAGQTVTDPARRVQDHQAVQVLGALPSAPSGGTVLVHKPAGMPAQHALQQAWGELGAGPLPSRQLRELWPLPDAASGLSVWSDAPAVLRRLADHERPLELEWLLSLPLASSAAALACLQAQGARLSLSHERDGLGHWRVVGKGLAAAAWPSVLDSSQFPGAGWRRQRLGRLGLAPLQTGQARWLRASEKF
ncbi:MAG: Ribosomal large subunit pseudouridine synthase [Pseudomonadota bacterium]|jgi:23S rRNA pseudouridine2604 synthase